MFFFLSIFLIAHYINSYSASNINRFLLVSKEIKSSKDLLRVSPRVNVDPDELLII